MSPIPERHGFQILGASGMGCDECYYVYVLESLKDGQFYSGYAEDLNQRLERHHNGEVPSTKYRRPLKLIFHEGYLKKSDALRREKYFKTTKGKVALKMMLRDYLEERKVINPPRP